MDLLALLRDPNVAPSPVEPDITRRQNLLAASGTKVDTPSSASVNVSHASRLPRPVAKPTNSAASSSSAAALPPQRSRLFKTKDRVMDVATQRNLRREKAEKEKKGRRSEAVNKRRPGLEEVVKDEATKVQVGGRGGQKETIIERLKQYRERQMQKKEEEKRHKKQPFKVGVYKLESRMTEDVGRVGRGNNMPVVSANSSVRKRKVGTPKNNTSSLQKKPKAAKVLVLDDVAKEEQPPPAQAEQQQQSDQQPDPLPIPIIRRRSSRLASRSSLLSQSIAEEESSKPLNSIPEDDHLGDLSPLAFKLMTPLRPEVGLLRPITSTCPSKTSLTPALGALNIDFEDGSKSSKRRRSRRRSVAPIQVAPPANMEITDQIPAPAPALTLNTVPTFNFLSEAEQKDFRFSAQSRPDAVPEDFLFKTPTSAAKRQRRNTKRLSGFSMLLDPLAHRHEINFERGSGSEKRRRKKGLNPFDGFKDWGLDDLPDNPNSPVHLQLENIFKTRNPLELSEGRKLPDDLLKTVDTILSTEKRKSIEKRRSSVGARNFGEELEAIEIGEAATDAHDVPYFRRHLQAEEERLRGLCQTWEDKLVGRVASTSSAVPTIVIPDDETQGQIRSVIGKARLLIEKKGRFEQFAKLVNDCDFKRGEKPTTCTDLQGFWDMIYFQVEETDKAFQKLAELEANSWIPSSVVEEQENLKPKKKVMKRVAIKAPAKASSSLREMLAAKRRQQKGDDIGTTDDLKVFDAGFFSVASPVRKVTAAAPTDSPARKSLATSMRLNLNNTTEEI